jgi:hypothetical protein
LFPEGFGRGCDLPFGLAWPEPDFPGLDFPAPDFPGFDFFGFDFGGFELSGFEFRVFDFFFVAIVGAWLRSITNSSVPGFLPSSYLP